MSTTAPCARVLGQLGLGVVTEDTSGHYAVGPAAPAPPQDAVLLRPAATARLWAALLGSRLRDRTATRTGFRTTPPAPAGGEPNLLAINARRLTRPMLDVYLEHFPHAQRVLDLGAGTASILSSSRGAA